MEITTVPSSQIQPVSTFKAIPSTPLVKAEVENFFFSKGPLVYKIYKNAYTSSLGDSITSDAFIDDFFVVLENSIKTEIKANNNQTNNNTTIVSNIFQILRNSFTVLRQSGVNLDPVTFYATLVAFVLSKIK